VPRNTSVYKTCTTCGYFRCRCDGWRPPQTFEPPPVSGSIAEKSAPGIRGQPPPAVSALQEKLAVRFYPWVSICHIGPYKGHACRHHKGSKISPSLARALGISTDQSGFAKVATSV
jgi:hypothetical protein